LVERNPESAAAVVAEFVRKLVSSRGRGSARGR
jgi:hypothetical protein